MVAAFGQSVRRSTASRLRINSLLDLRPAPFPSPAAPDLCILAWRADALPDDCDAVAPVLDGS